VEGGEKNDEETIAKIREKHRLIMPDVNNGRSSLFLVLGGTVQSCCLEPLFFSVHRVLTFESFLGFHYLNMFLFFTGFFIMICLLGNFLLEYLKN
jgi:hypothetical protein